MMRLKQENLLSERACEASNEISAVSLHSENSYSKKLLQKLCESWQKRARVRSNDLYDDNIPAFDLTAKDFLEDLLPFSHHNGFANLSEAEKSPILTSGWLIYNEKTVAIENDIITPVCQLILNENLPGISDAIFKEIISETMIDEAYHTLLVVNANNVTRRNRNINVQINSFHLIKQMRMEQAKHPEPWKKKLIHIATAIVSEIFISDYLKLLSESSEVQPFNRLVVATHRRDELAHKSIFTEITKYLYAALNKEQKQFFADVLPKPVRWFVDKELGIWRSVLKQLGVYEADKFITASEAANIKSLENIDYSGLIDLATEIGILGSSEGEDAFYREGLIS